MPALQSSITSKKAEKFHTTANKGDTLWCTKSAGFHLHKYATKTSWRVKYRANGQQHIKTFGNYPQLTPKQAVIDAKEILEKARKGIDEVKLSKDKKNEAAVTRLKTFGAYLNEAYSVKQQSQKSGKETIRLLNKEFSEWLKLPIEDLTISHADKWNQKQANLGKSYSTIRRYWAACKGLLNYAVKKQYIRSNPLGDWSPEKLRIENTGKVSTRQYLENNEAVRLVSKLLSNHECVYSNILALIYFTGLRPSDALSLKWEHVNLNFKTLSKVIEKTSEIKLEPTTLELNESVIDLLKKWQKVNGSRSGLIFPNKQGKQIHHRTLARKMNGDSRLGIDGIISGLDLPEGFTPYSLRHNFASQLIMKGADIVTVSKLMCHSKIETTIKHYASLAPDHKREVANLMNIQMDVEEQAVVKV